MISNSDYDEAHKSKFKTFKDEVEMLSLFKGNDCIVQVYTYCLDFPRAYIIYEYLPNDTLARSIHGKLVRQSYLQILQVRRRISLAHLDLPLNLPHKLEQLSVPWHARHVA